MSPKDSRAGTCEWESIAAELLAQLEGHAQAFRTDPKYAPEPCNEPIEAKRVCRKHYHKRKKLISAAPRLDTARGDAADNGQVSPAARRTNGAATSTGLVTSGVEAKDRVARVADYSVWQDYAQDPKDKRKKLMAAGDVWMGTAYVDMDAGDRYNDLSLEEIDARHKQRVAEWAEAEANAQKIPKKQRGNLEELLCRLLYGIKGRETRAMHRFGEQVSEANANDHRARSGLDTHGRREKALRSIDMVAAAKKLGLEPDLGDDETVKAVLAAIETGVVKS